MAPPGRERIAAMLEYIPPANREEVLKELLGLHKPVNREALREAKQVKAVLTSPEQEDFGIGPRKYPIQALIHREPGKFFAFEAGAEEAEVVVLLIDNSLYENRNYVLRAVRDRWHALVFETRDNFGNWWPPDPDPELKPDGWPFPLIALILVVGLGLGGLVSQCNGGEDISNNDMGPTPIPSPVVEKDDAREPAPDMPVDEHPDTADLPSKDLESEPNPEETCQAMCARAAKVFGGKYRYSSYKLYKDAVMYCRDIALVKTDPPKCQGLEKSYSDKEIDFLKMLCDSWRLKQWNPDVGNDRDVHKGCQGVGRYIYDNNDYFRYNGYCSKEDAKYCLYAGMGYQMRPFLQKEEPKESSKHQRTALNYFHHACARGLDLGCFYITYMNRYGQNPRFPSKEGSKERKNIKEVWRILENLIERKPTEDSFLMVEAELDDARHPTFDAQYERADEVHTIRLVDPDTMKAKGLGYCQSNVPAFEIKPLVGYGGEDGGWGMETFETADILKQNTHAQPCLTLDVEGDKVEEIWFEGVPDDVLYIHATPTSGQKAYQLQGYCKIGGCGTFDKEVKVYVRYKKNVR